PALATIEPGQGYRVHLDAAATLRYGTPPTGRQTYRVATIEDAMALPSLAPGDSIVVTDPVRGGRFAATESACVPDGGTCFIPLSASEATTASLRSTSATQTLFDGEGVGAVDAETFRLSYGPTGSDTFAAVRLHGHGGGGTEFDPFTRSISVGNSLRSNTPGPYRALYRYATSRLRFERDVEPIVLFGRETREYVRPGWWGAIPYPDGWQPDPSTPAPNEDPTLDPAIAALDATAEIATALNVASSLAQATGREWPVVLDAMYGYAGVIETQQDAPLKGEQDGVRDGQGLRVIKGAPWRFWSTRSQAAADYAQAKRVSDYLIPQGEPWVLLQHGRDAMLARVADLEVDGNLAENDYVFEIGYRVASGAPGNRLWWNAVDELLQNTPHWNGFSVHRSSPWYSPQNANIRLENVHIHDVGGNGILGNDWVHFGGSRDVRVGNVARNHSLYGVTTAPGTWVDGVEVYGFYWKGGIDPSQGRYRNVSYDIAGPSPYTGDPLEEFAGPRNDNPNPSLFRTEDAGVRHYWGEDVVFEGVEMLVRADAVPRLGYLGYTSGPVTYRDIAIRLHPTQPGAEDDRDVFLTYSGHADQSDQSSFRLEDVQIHSGVEVSRLASLRAQINVIDNVVAENGGRAGQIIVRPGATPQKLLALVRNVSRFEDLHVFPTGGDRYKNIGFDILVEGSPGAPTIVDGSDVHGSPLTTNGLDATDPVVQANGRVAWRDVVFGGFRDNSTVAIQSFERVSFGERTSEDAGSLSGTALASGSVDVPTSLFLAPQSPDYVMVSGPDASRFRGWTLAPSSTPTAPVLRLSFSGSGPVSVDWSAAIRPIPADLTGTE
ncbi:hypothetical protein, partial [Rubrivirga sp.]|uniref:hypothetical protein n=1 Tax=Rubrivirga sp. TaxID=1885344 RepID=UPI003C729371